MVYTSNGNSGAMAPGDATPSGAGYAATFAIGLTFRAAWCRPPKVNAATRERVSYPSSFRR